MRTRDDVRVDGDDVDERGPRLGSVRLWKRHGLSCCCGSPASVIADRFVGGALPRGASRLWVSYLEASRTGRGTHQCASTWRVSEGKKWLLKSDKVDLKF